MGGPGAGASLGLGAGLAPVDALPPATCSLCRRGGGAGLWGETGGLRDRQAEGWGDTGPREGWRVPGASPCPWSSQAGGTTTGTADAWLRRT